MWSPAPAPLQLAVWLPAPAAMPVRALPFYRLIMAAVRQVAARLALAVQVLAWPAVMGQVLVRALVGQALLR